jgi:prepilin-type N-terminal cleavage/methylation domain-containing protein
MKHSTNRTIIPAGYRRHGVTLTEVLMSLMIMSIGVVSLATLFPLAAARTIEATNYTNSTILRHNAAALVETIPELVGDPDGNAATREPRRFIVDPLGFHELQLATGTPQTTYGNNAPATVNTPLPFRYPGLPTGALTLAQAQKRASNLVRLGDTFTQLAEGFASSFTTTNVVVPGEVDLSTVDPSVSTYRAIIFDATGRRSEVRTLTGLTPLGGPGPYTLTWDVAEPLPTSFATVGLVRVQSPTEYYTWMLSVRDSAAGRNIDIVAFLKRSFTLQSEQVYEADFRRFELDPNNLDPTKIDGDGLPGNPGDDDGDSTADDRLEIGYPGSDDQPNFKAYLRWTSTMPTPALIRGGYVLDTRNLRWYRIRAIEDETGSSATLLLEDAIVADNTEDLYDFGIDTPDEDLNGNSIREQGGAILPTGVVGVFNYKSKRREQ